MYLVSKSLNFSCDMCRTCSKHTSPDHQMVRQIILNHTLHEQSVYIEKGSWINPTDVLKIEYLLSGFHHCLGSTQNTSAEKVQVGRAKYCHEGYECNWTCTNSDRIDVILFCILNIANIMGAVFWVIRVYILFILKYILDTFWNIKKNETKNPHIHFHVLRAHKIISWKNNMLCGACKNDKISVLKLRLFTR
jgi:hypothetical protein